MIASILFLGVCSMAQAESPLSLEAAAGAAPLARLLLQDPARAVRLSAATALGEIAAPESREALTQAARQDSDSLVRSRSEDALAKLPR
jgi:HEAT repeat protein